MRVPQRLERDTLIECTAEVWFTSPELSAAELLPGLLFQSVGKQFPRLQRLPGADIPKNIRSTNPSLQRLPLQVLEGDFRKILIGDRSLGISFQKPYPGWSAAQPIINEVINALANSGLALQMERASLKYSNLIESSNEVDQLELVDVGLSINGFELRRPGRFIRGEIEKGELRCIIDVKTGATAHFKGRSAEGMLLEIDVIGLQLPSNQYGEYPRLLDQLHDMAKEVFFRTLKQTTIESLGPVWSL